MIIGYIFELVIIFCLIWLIANIARALWTLSARTEGFWWLYKHIIREEDPNKVIDKFIKEKENTSEDGIDHGKK